MPTDALTCLILAGGQSSRMGTDKAALMLDGSSFLDRAISLAHDVGATTVHILGRADHPLGIRDEEQFAGPARAIANWIDRPRETNRILVLPIDMPLLRPEHLAPLLSAESGAYFDDLYLPFTARLQERLDFEGSRMTSLLSALGAKKLPVPRIWKDTFVNVNDARSYEIARKRLPSG